MNIERKDYIRQYVQDKGEITLKELEEKFPEYSSMTLRRDMLFLEEQGVLRRTRGGAIALSRLSGAAEDRYSLRAIRNMQNKMRMAHKAASLVETGGSLFIDSGTTTMCLASALPDEDFFVITSGPNIALELLKKSKPIVNVLGGHVSRTTLSASGAHAMRGIEELNIDIAFMGTSAFSLQTGFTSGVSSESEIKRAVIQKARKKVMLMDLSKVDRNMPYTFAQLADIDVLVTDGELPEEIMRSAQAQGVQIL